MQVAARIGTMARCGAPLPYLRRVAYLKSTGTQFIDTGLVVDSSYNVEIAWRYEGSGTIRLFGNTDLSGASGVTYQIGKSQTGTTVSIYKMTSSYISVPASQFASKVTLKSDGQSWYIDGSLIGTNTAPKSWTTEHTAYLFALNSLTGAIVSTADVVIYSSEVRRNGNTVMKLLPVLDLSGRPCFYDEVSGNLFYNQGTGEFTWGEFDAAYNAPLQLGGV